MTEWMENVEKAIARIMADKVYTSAEFKRERDNFHVSLKKQLSVNRGLGLRFDNETNLKALIHYSKAGKYEFSMICLKFNN